MLPQLRNAIRARDAQACAGSFIVAAPRLVELPDGDKRHVRESSTNRFGRDLTLKNDLLISLYDAEP